jgi:hypothetical protein
MRSSSVDAKEARRVCESVLHDMLEFSVDSRVIEEIDGAKLALSLPSNGEREKWATPDCNRGNRNEHIIDPAQP